MDMQTDPGLQPDGRAWQLDEDLVKMTKDAVLALRVDNDFGPRNRDRLVFRASELGDVASYRDAHGEPGGCHRKTFFSFWPERFKPRDFTAEELMNFAKGVEEQEVMKRYLVKAGLFVEEEVRLGAWTPCRGTDGNGLPKGCADIAHPTCGVFPHAHADPRFPDRSGGIVRGRADFIINHPKHGKIPLEWKSCSSYIFDAIKQLGPKGDNGLQAHFYGHEMGTAYVALGYVNKETGDVAIFTAKTDIAIVKLVFERAVALKGDILAGNMPALPDGVRAPKDYYDRAWPCYYYAPKKKRVGVCPFFEYCHGKPPVEADAGAPPKRTYARRRKTDGAAPISFNS